MPDRDTAPAVSRRIAVVRRVAVESVCTLLVVVLTSLLFWSWYQDPRRIMFSGDSYWYMRKAMIFSGQSADSAVKEATALVCQDINRSLVAQDRPATCTGYRGTGFSPRYVDIFDTRPGYPLFATLFVEWLGAWNGMVAATLVLALGAAVLAYLAVWLATGYRLAGIVGAVALFVLPSGFWMTRILAESATMFGIFAALFGATLVWRGRLYVGTAFVIPALAWLFAVRSASGMAVALALLGAAVLTFIKRPRETRARGLLVTIGLGLAVVAAWALVSARLQLPGLYETIQDNATRHFREPDIPDPYGFLIDENLKYWPEQLLDVLKSPASLTATLFAFAVLLVRLRWVGWMWVAVGLTGIMMQVAHPVGSQWDRMMLPVNVPIAAALGYAGALALRRVKQPTEAEPEPEPEPEKVEPATKAEPAPKAEPEAEAQKKAEPDPEPEKEKEPEPEPATDAPLPSHGDFRPAVRERLR